MCPLPAPPNPIFLLLQPFTVLTRQTRQAVCAIKQSISLDVYEQNPPQEILSKRAENLKERKSFKTVYPVLKKKEM
jgi:hypothetical protein